MLTDQEKIPLVNHYIRTLNKFNLHIQEIGENYNYFIGTSERFSLILNHKRYNHNPVLSVGLFNIYFESSNIERIKFTLETVITEVMTTDHYIGDIANRVDYLLSMA